MGNTFKLGNYVNGLFQDASNNIGIGGSPSGSYKLEVTGTAKVSSTLLVSGASTLTGAVGVGIAAPSSGLEVYNSGGGPTIRVTNSGTGTGSGNGFHIGVDVSAPLDVAFVQNENASQVFYTNDGTSTAERLRIRSGGKVTIPSGAYGTSYYTMNYTSANAGSREWAIGSDTAGWGSFSIGQATTQGGSTFSDKIIISSAGNVGIGINSTSAKLYVLGSNEVFNVAGTNAVSTYTGYYYNTSTLVGYIGNGSSILSGAASSDFIFRSEGALVYAIGNSEKMRLFSTGKLRIATPIADDICLFVQNTSATGYGCAIQGGNGSTYSFKVENYNSSFISFQVRGDGQVNVGAYTYANGVGTPRTVYIDSAGTLGGISSILASKTNIKQFDTNWLYDLKPVQFNYRKKDENEQFTDEFDNELYYGLIAEETELVNKELCTYKDDKLMGIEYSKLVPVLVKAIQELNQQNQDLKSRLDKAGL